MEILEIIKKKYWTKFKGNIGLDIFHLEQGQKQPAFHIYSKAPSGEWGVHNSGN